MLLKLLYGIYGAALFVAALPTPRSTQTKILLSNDDGWASANIRAQFASLTSEDYNVVLSAPAVNQSGTGSAQFPPTPVLDGCEFNSCPPGSPPTGFNASDPRLNYVNSFPATSVQVGIDNIGPNFFNGGQPDLVVAGPNVGSNTGLINLFSGTVGAAVEAVLGFGIPAIAISGGFSTQTSFTTLDTPSDSTTAAEVYAALSTKLVDALLAPGFSASSPILPNGTLLNVNYPVVTSGSACASVDAFQFILTRSEEAVADLTPPDVNTCESDRLPIEADVIARTDGCFASVSVLSALTKLDADEGAQAAVLSRLGSFLSCLP